MTGFSNEIVGLAVGSHRNSVCHWIKTYQHDGLQALMSKDYSTNISELEQHSHYITEEFTRHPPRSIGEAVLKI